jgi:hypothetical protein
MSPTYTAAHQNAEILQNLLKEWTSNQVSPLGKSKKRRSAEVDRRTPEHQSSSTLASRHSTSPVSSNGSPTIGQLSPTPQQMDASSQPPPWSSNINRLPTASSSSSTNQHHMHTYQQHQQQHVAWDNSFQRVLHNMDVAQPFSFRTFGIESANNPFPPLPTHGYGPSPMDMMHSGYPPPPPAMYQQHHVNGVSDMNGGYRGHQSDWNEHGQQQQQQQQQVHYQYFSPPPSSNGHGHSPQMHGSGQPGWNTPQQF